MLARSFNYFALKLCSRRSLSVTPSQLGCDTKANIVPCAFVLLSGVTKSNNDLHSAIDVSASALVVAFALLILLANHFRLDRRRTWDRFVVLRLLNRLDALHDHRVAIHQHLRARGQLEIVHC